MVNLLVGQLRKTIQVIERIVNQVEYLVGHPFIHFFLGECAHTQVVALHDHFRNLHHLFRDTVRNKNLELHVVIVFLPATQLLHVLRVVWIVVDGCHRAEFVESPREHSFRVEIGKAQRTNHFRHSLFPTIPLNGIQQGTRNVHVVDEVNPTEAYTLAPPALVGFVVDNRSHTASHLPVFISEEIFSLTELESGIFLTVQHVTLITEQVGDIILVARIQVIMKINESFQRLLVRDFPYLNTIHNPFSLLVEANQCIRPVLIVRFIMQKYGKTSKTQNLNQKSSIFSENYYICRKISYRKSS